MIFNIKNKPNTNNIPYFRITNIKNALSTIPSSNRHGITQYGIRPGADIAQGITQSSTQYGIRPGVEIAQVIT
jgi:hypothetical protein